MLSAAFLWKCQKTTDPPNIPGSIVVAYPPGNRIACACMLERLSDILHGGAISHPGILGEQIDVPYDLLGMAFPALYKLYLEQ
ncbi:hypothetical protein PGTUg99_022426 [Puccinia graminis f. sp. tritici]|uniref:Uncharacterized protein n=1 Tax=Puccinia graminis f. sp. tritici TaxID=56615 RepID=A0A5B0RCI6_PUCGR|nr:hypothetical protein PGTUg99_022426 [Puccinia graminis f. sp. tritici]